MPEQDVRKHLGRVNGLSHTIKVLGPHSVRVEATADAVTSAPTSRSIIGRIPEAGTIFPRLAHPVPVMIAGLRAHLVRVRVGVPGGKSATRLGRHPAKRTGLTRKLPPHSTHPYCLLRRTGHALTEPISRHSSDLLISIKESRTSSSQISPCPQHISAPANTASCNTPYRTRPRLCSSETWPCPHRHPYR